jgi:hypothetical protein
LVSWLDLPYRTQAHSSAHPSHFFPLESLAEKKNRKKK